MLLRIVKVSIAIILFLTCCISPATAPAEVTAAGSRKAAPGFSLSDSNGAAVSLSQSKGKVVLLNFWATWCHGCQEEIPWYMEFAGKYKDRGLVVIGVSMDDDGWKSVKPFIQAKKLNYPVVIGNQDLMDNYGGFGMPVSVLIDRDGKIADTHSGVVDKGGWEREIQQLLGESSKPVSK
ncbi:MAG TPA: TlpA disulfide reductase family protein [Candidatus Angelobacter sp.]|nr:TlpA disulfide reductase family protein [Candidatus Angelobacter sp.]